MYDDFLNIEWDDKPVSNLRLIDVRFHCPCAHCQNLRDEINPKHLLYFKQDEAIVKNIELSGKYALKIDWADGHNMGIYEFPLLKKISEIQGISKL